MRPKPTVAVLGAGIFGLNAAVELSKDYDVDLIEQLDEPLRGATFANHNRHHFGFHYPRSRDTALQCLSSADSFSEWYGDALFWDFDNYYCVGRKGSKVSPEAYLNFCRDVGLQFEQVAPPEDIIDPQQVDLCLKVREPICDYQILRRMAADRLRASRVQGLFKCSVVSGRVELDGRKTLELNNNGRTETRQYDVVVNAMYANYNQFCKWFGFDGRSFQFNLQELDLISLPRARKFGVTIMDGVFPSVLPYGQTGLYIMAHVEVSQLVRESSFQTKPLMSRLINIESKWDEILKVSLPYLPILKQATYRRSIYVDRVVDAGQSADDARLTEITDHGQGCWSVFAAKIITCVQTSNKLASTIRGSLG